MPCTKIEWAIIYEYSWFLACFFGVYRRRQKKKLNPICHCKCTNLLCLINTVSKKRVQSEQLVFGEFFVFRFQTNIYGFWFVCQLCCVVHNRLCLSYIIRTRHTTNKKTGFKTQNLRWEKKTYKNIFAAAADAFSVVGSFVLSTLILFGSMVFVFYDFEMYTTLLCWDVYDCIISTNERKKNLKFSFCIETKWSE